MARYDALSGLILGHDELEVYVKSILQQYAAEIAALQANSDYAAETSAGEKAVVAANLVLVNAAVSGLAKIIP